MSKFFFTKFHGAGNDFILIDDRALAFNPQIVRNLCHRKFGIGADGVILLQNDLEADFRMRIFNVDGSEAESCGNGLRCFAKFLLELGFPKQTYRIATGSRFVDASFLEDKIAIKMGAVLNVKRHCIRGYEVYALNTGVPHAVIFGEEKLDVLGPMLQWDPAFLPSGTNVNLVQMSGEKIYVRTFERGVGETLSCGTGAAAVGYLVSKMYHLPNPICICTAGGNQYVQVEEGEVILIGDAHKVFAGFWENDMVSQLEEENS